MIEQFANDATSDLAVQCLIGDSEITVVSAGTFPTAGPFRIRIDDELLLVTSVAGSMFTVSRGIEGTMAAAHAQGVAVTHIITAGGLAAAIATIPSTTILPGTAPSAPTAGFTLYVDVADNTLKAIASTGTITPLALP